MQLNLSSQRATRVVASHRHATPVVTAPRRSNRTSSVAAKAVQTPSNATAASELQSLGRLSTIVPDTLAMETLTPGAKLAAGTVSASVLRSVIVSESLGLKPYENAIMAAMAAGKNSNSPLAAAADPLDRALVNVGAMLCDVVWGRVETIVDPNLATDQAAITEKVRLLAALYAALRVPRDRLIFGLPATWAATQAAKTLEAEGIATSLYMVFSAAQGIAAMQAGASVIRINVGRLREWYDKNPGAIRNPHGPREDTGAPTAYDPAIELVKELYCYGRKYHPKSAIMAMGLRTRQDALDLAGLDYLILSGRVMSQLAAVDTDQGYNDGLSAVAGSSGVEAVLTPALAAQAEVKQWSVLTEPVWKSELGPAATELLAAALKLRANDVTELKKLLASRSSAAD
ncbi:hypothetical protein HXX76_009685 [Chlamydomonas incerta]|uniref:Transaldolase n=1 Tax=Chlamydomonas incerta TaxID=51695 RepID=A0A835VX54_CHLIN|nr:hypothetical protein HXX76_009685 [Chlamydomonas incerta]|eukprot:KAG2431155.1 hypothetical protein HXX76_009685 [Chlamydomonas incerta]